MALCCALFLLAPVARGQETRIDVVVYGATPAGIAAAVSAAKDGQSVLLVEPTDRIGGMLTSGLSWTDARTLESLTGSYQQFCMRVERFYIAQYGIGSPPHQGSFRGLHGEPGINLQALSQMLNDMPPVRLLRKYKLASVDIGGRGELKFIRTVQFVSASGMVMSVRGKEFIDATYEGDLMAKAGVEYTVGREGPEAYGESLAKDVPKGGDKQVQGYNFRLSMTKLEDNRVFPKAPKGYKREDFTGILPVLESGKIKHVFTDGLDGIFRTHLPLMANGKSDVSDTPNGLVRLSMPDIDEAYPDGDETTRQRIYDQHQYYTQGLLYFLQNDKEVPVDLQDSAREWGFCKDEFIENGNFPPLLYVREARRMVGQYVFTQNDVMTGANDVRTKHFADAIAIGDFSLNCIGTGREGTRFEGKQVGEFYQEVPPFQVPYGVIVPKKIGNLLVPVAVSASHVGFSCLRTEPMWMSLGQAAGHAAALAIFENKPVQAITVPMLQDKLHVDKLATIYLSDVGPGSSLFKPAQWFGTRGAFHGLVDPSALKMLKQEKVVDQYMTAAPGHEVNPRTKIDEATLARWVAIAQAEGIDVKKAGRLTKLMRGEVLEKLYWVKYPPPKKK